MPFDNNNILRRALLAGTISPPRCALDSCASLDGLLRCGGCKVIKYCSVEHQTLHRPSHKSACNKIKKTHLKLYREEADLRSRPAEFTLPADVFNTSVGHFWRIIDTRDCMRARHAHMDALIKVNTGEAVQLALDHAMDMLRLCRSDNLGIRDVVPWLLLRLNKEQECYDFIKWWVTIDSPAGYDGHYDWGDMSLPYLDIQGADAFEPVTPLVGQYPNLNHVVALTLLKLRLYLDADAYEFDDSPEEFGPLMRPTGQIVSRRVARGDWARIQDIRGKMESQFTELCAAVHNANRHFWKLLMDGSTCTPPAYYSPGSREQAELVHYLCKQAWFESEDALLMVEAETVKFMGVYEPKPVPRAQIMTDSAPDALILAFDDAEMVKSVHKELLSRMTRLGRIQIATTHHEAYGAILAAPIDTPILVADRAISRNIGI